MKNGRRGFGSLNLASNTLRAEFLCASRSAARASDFGSARRCGCAAGGGFASGAFRPGVLAPLRFLLGFFRLLEGLEQQAHVQSADGVGRGLLGLGLLKKSAPGSWLR